MKRKLKKVTCKMCDFIGKTNGISEHIKTHKITVDEYIDKFGEYRPKYLDYIHRASLKFECKICNKKCASDRHLTYHIKQHGVDKRSYVIKYILNNEIPKCKCGCGEEIKVLTYYPYHVNHISGHNTYMHIGMTRSKASRLKMRKSAINRIKNKKGVYFYNGISKQEIKLKNFIKENYKGNVICNDKELLSGLELDIYIPDLNLAIELNGERFHCDLFKNKRYHLNKTIECNDQGIHLIHIWMSDWTQKQDIVKSILLNKMNVNKIKIYARNTKVKILPNNILQVFLNKNHIQGQCISRIRLGLYDKNDTLIQIMAFSSLRKATGLISKDNHYELIRFCSEQNVSVIGGASKLLSYFIKKYKPLEIISFANRDWSNGNLYKTLGFDFVKYTEPGYFYCKGKRKYHRYKFQKHKLVAEGYDSNKTEYEIMTDRGFYRIWNTGNLLFKLDIYKYGQTTKPNYMFRNNRRNAEKRFGISRCYMFNSTPNIC